MTQTTSDRNRLRFTLISLAGGSIYSLNAQTKLQTLTETRAFTVTQKSATRLKPLGGEVNIADY